ncbi:MAG: glycosyltransferase [Proteobacteria bacterium]|nr:glycosyltransferase [Pseudomonadota bacterium]
MTFLAGVLATPFVVVFLVCRPGRAREFVQRLGFYGPLWKQAPSGARRVWIHGSSVGEMNIARALAESIREQVEDAEILVSAFTATGVARAAEIPGVRSVFFPMDLSCAVRRSLSAWRPHALVILETELWPNMMALAGRRGTRLLLLNGRFSPRAFQSYRRWRALFGPLLARFDHLSMITSLDRDRVLALGGPKGRVSVDGNAKYDSLAERPSAATADRVRRLLDLSGQPVFVAGSIRSPEEGPIIDVCCRLRREIPDLVSILIPRHLTRVEPIAAALTERGVAFQKRSELGRGDGRRTAPVVVVDTMGELFDLYSAADVAFVGASLVDLGGQNPLEPAAWGVPVLYGPSMEDFLDATEILEPVGAGIRVADAEELFQAARRLLSDEDERRRRGRAGQEALAGRGRVAEVLAARVAAILRSGEHGQ